jgi:hypothetical protein
MAQVEGQNVEQIPTGGDAAPEVQTNAFSAEFAMSMPTSFKPEAPKVEPDFIDTGDLWGSGEFKNASLERERRTPAVTDEFGLPDGPKDQRIKDEAKKEFEKDKPGFEKIIKEDSDQMHRDTQDGKPDRLKEEVQRFFTNLDMFKNTDLPDGLRKDALLAAGLSGKTLEQFITTTSSQTKDGEPVKFDMDEKAKKFSITIGESTMTIDSKGQIEMNGAPISQSEFLKKLKPVTGGNAQG